MEVEQESKQTDLGYMELLKQFYNKYIVDRKKAFFTLQFLHILGALIVLIPPMILRELLDHAIPEGVMSQVYFLAVLALGVYVFGDLISAVKIYWGHKVAQVVTRDMRNDLYRHYQDLSLSFHDNKKTGELMSRVIDDLNVCQEFVHHGPEGIVGSVVLIFGTVGVLFYMSIPLTLLSLLFVPFLVFYSYFLFSKMHSSFRYTRQKVADMTDRLEDNLSGMKVIKAFANEDYENERFSEQNDSHKTARLTAIKYMSMLLPGSRFLNNIGLLVVLTYGAYLVIGDVITLGTIVAFHGLLLQFRAPLLRLVRVNEQLSMFFASIERFFTHLNIKPSITAVDGDAEKHIPDKVEGEVTFKNVNFSYEPDEVVLKDISFHVDADQTVALVGPSGSGKTSIVRLIPRLYEIDFGSLLVDGVDVREWNLKSLRSSIAMVMQDDYLFSDSVIENIAYGRPSASEEEIIEVAREANAHQFIEELPDGYNTAVGQRGVKLSGGQRQRVSIARALLKDPDILILDEATSSVDTETEKLIQEAIERVTTGRTTFIIAHRLSTIVNADDILFIEQGRIRERGTHDELMSSETKYREFYQLQFEVQGKDVG